MRELTKKEYFILKRVSFKHNKYYCSNIRLKTDKQILEAMRAKLEVKCYDSLMDCWFILNQ